MLKIPCPELCQIRANTLPYMQENELSINEWKRESSNMRLPLYRAKSIDSGEWGNGALDLLQSNLDPGSWFLVHRYDRERSRIHVD